jgi:hypothetical protein
LAAQRTVEHTSENHSPFADYGGTIPRAASHSAWWWIMDEAKTARAEAIFASDEMAKAKFEAQLKAHREKTARLRAERLARLEASWVERRQDTIANIKSGIVELQIKTALMKARRFIKLDD